MGQQHDPSQDVQETASTNIAQALDLGPGIRYSTGIFVIVKDTKNKRVLLGGLGGMGVGQMWGILNEHNMARPSYADAPDINTETHDAYLDYFKGKIVVRERR